MIMRAGGRADGLREQGEGKIRSVGPIISRSDQLHFQY